MSGEIKEGTEWYRGWQIFKSFLFYEFRHPDCDRRNDNEWRYGSALTMAAAVKEIDRLMAEEVVRRPPTNSYDLATTLAWAHKAHCDWNCGKNLDGTPCSHTDLCTALKQAVLATDKRGKTAQHLLIDAIGNDPVAEQIRAGTVRPHHVAWEQAIAAIDAALALSERIPDGWIGWSGGAVPVQGTETRGLILFKHETVGQAETRGEAILDHWPWYGEDEQPIVVAYKLAPSKRELQKPVCWRYQYRDNEAVPWHWRISEREVKASAVNAHCVRTPEPPFASLEANDSPPCPWCDSREHWAGRVNMCPSRAARMVTQTINTLPEPGEGWQAYALRLHKQLGDEAERVA